MLMRLILAMWGCQCGQTNSDIFPTCGACGRPKGG